MQYPLINLSRNVAYLMELDGSKQICGLSEADVEFYNRPIDNVYIKRKWTFAFDGLIGSTFEISIDVTTVADFINGWNYTAIIKGLHTLAAYVDYEEELERIAIFNTCQLTVHLWADSVYMGAWTSGEYRMFTFAEFFSINAFVQSPIMVTATTPVFEVTAYLFRKRDAGFYTKSEVVCIPPGFYADLETFVATLNLSVSMRGERNGYIYNFFIRRTRKGETFIGVEASHRQPEPSSLVIRPMVAAEALGQLEEINLPLRTNKRAIFELPIQDGFIIA